MAKSFAAQIDEWVGTSKNRIEAVVKASAIDVADVMQNVVSRQPNPKPGHGMPVDTQFLRGSLEVNFTGPVPMNKANPYTEIGSAPDWNRSEFIKTVYRYRLGQTIYASYGAEYAGHVHYGTQGREGRQFVTLASQQWVSIVHRNAAKLKTSTTVKAA